MNVSITVQQFDFRQFIKNQIKIKGLETSGIVVFFHPDGAACVEDVEGFHGVWIGGWMRQPEKGANEMVSGCSLLVFCPRRRFAAYHEQGQAPAPRAASTIPCLISGCLIARAAADRFPHPARKWETMRPHRDDLRRRPNPCIDLDTTAPASTSLAKKQATARRVLLSTWRFSFRSFCCFQAASVA